VRYHLLGQTGLYVSELCLGTMTYGGSKGIWENIGSLQQDAVNEQVKFAVEAGINFIDTANVYSMGKSEMLLGQALKTLGLPREQLIIATKSTGTMDETPNGRGQSRHHIFNAIGASLKRLQLDYVDLYQLHGFDPLTPFEESLSALNDLVRSGRVRYIGLCNMAAWQIMKSLACLIQIALAWILSKPFVSSVIIGAKSMDQLRDNVAASRVELTEEEIKSLDEVSQLPPEYPGWMIAFQSQSRAKPPFKE